MDDDVKLKMVLGRAKENGWFKDWEVLMVGEQKEYISTFFVRFGTRTPVEEDRLVFSREVKTILLSVDFAKAYFGGDIDVWGEHLKQAVFAEDLIDYYFNNFGYGDRPPENSDTL